MLMYDCALLSSSSSPARVINATNDNDACERVRFFFFSGGDSVCLRVMRALSALRRRARATRW